MNTQVKKNNRQKAIFGIDDAIVGAIIGGLIAAGGSLGASAIKANADKKLAEQQRRRELQASNAENAAMAQTNETQALNYDQNNELETMKTSKLSTVDAQQSNFRCGGKRRMKRNGGNVTSDLSKLGLYI